ncbi:cold shock CspA family protein [Bradyrhizobium ottawaense]
MGWGELVRWNSDRGFGFVKSDFPAMEDVFVHNVVLSRAGIEPIVGTHLEFEIEMHKGQPRVKSVRRLKTWVRPS